jgi:pilus assembly protein Flp/PilA
MYRILLRKTVRFLRAEDGPTAVEYAVMLALIITVCVSAVTLLGSRTSSAFANPTLNSAAS